MNELKEETMFSIVRFANRFNIDIIPTDKIEYVEDELFTVVCLSDCNQFLNFHPKKIDFKVRLFFKNVKNKDYIMCRLKFILNGELLESYIDTNYDKEMKKWQGLDVGKLEK